MTIVYHRKTGQIIASFPECFGLAPHISITAGDEPAAHFAHHVLSPQEAHPFTDPRTHRSIHDHAVRLGPKGKIRGLVKVR